MATWAPRNRDYNYEKKKLTLPRKETSSHPLQQLTVTVSSSGGSKNTTSADAKNVKSSSSQSAILDPLSAALEGIDPLSQMVAEVALSRSQGSEAQSGDKKSDSELDTSFEPWSQRRAGILTKYTTSEKLSITTSFLTPSDKEKVLVKAAPASVSAKVKNRLEEIEDFEEGSMQEILNLSQQDYVKRIDDLNSEMISAWDQDQRVKALKIAIQAAKLLADLSVIQFYPSKFVLITDILDTFGRLVFDRIRSKATYFPKGSNVPVQLPEHFTANQVPESAKETCRNWFYKIASIRELMPRFYVETSILKCYSFLTSSEYDQALYRLALVVRGMGDPLAATYARCYLCRVGIMVAPKIVTHLQPCLSDFFTTYHQIRLDSVQNVLAGQKMALADYLSLYSPAVDWIMQCVAHKASDNQMSEVLDRVKTFCNNAMVLNSLISTFKPEFVALRALAFNQLILDCEESGFSKHWLYRSLGCCVVKCDPPQADKLPLLNDVWKAIMKLKSVNEYISCAEVWIEFVAKHFSKKEVNTVLADIMKHVLPDKAFEEHYPQLQNIVARILPYLNDFGALFTMEKFMTFIDLFQKESVKVEVCKIILDHYVRNQSDIVNDSVVINAIMYFCKVIHDSVSALTLDDEVRTISALICGFLRTVSFGRDFEQQLNFFVDARASFSNLDVVISHLVQSVNMLSIETRRVVKGNHTRKTAAFVRACSAYCFITIPSLANAFQRLNLYLISGQVALLNQSHSQADSFLKAAIALLPDVPRSIEVEGRLKSSEPLLLDFLRNLLSTLLIFPDNPEQGVMYLLRGLLNVLEDYPWDPQSDSKSYFYLDTLLVVTAAAQEYYIYHADNVESNEALYGFDPKFLAELSSISATLVEQVLTHIESLDKPEMLQRQSQLATEFFNRLVSHGDLSNDVLNKLAVKMWNLAQHRAHMDVKLRLRLLNHLKNLVNYQNDTGAKDLLSKLALESRT